MPLRVGIPYQPYSFLIKKLDGLIVAQDDKGRVRFSGTDAATVIQNAINALATGGKIFIKEGIYTLTSGLSITNDNVVFQGSGKATILKVADGANLNVPIIKVGDGTTTQYRVFICDLQIDGNRTNQTAGVAYGIHLDKVEECGVYHCHIRNTYPRAHGGGDGIRVTIPSWVSIVGNRIYSPGDRGMTVVGEYGVDTKANMVIAYNMIEDTLDRCISIESGKLGNYIENVVIANNVLKAGPEGSGIGIINWRNILIIGNTVIEAGRRGIRVLGRGTNCLIVSNTIRGNSWHGIDGGVDSNTERISIVGNTIEENGYSGIIFSGYEHGYGHMLIAFNRIAKNNTYGIKLEGISYSIITGNTVLDNGQSADNTYDGILLDERNTYYSTYNIVSGNLVRSTGTPRHRYNIAETSSNEDYNRIIDNIVMGAGTEEIRKQGANTVVRRNQGFVTENSGTATITAGATYVVVSHGLDVTPDINKIKVVPKDNLGGRSFHVDTVGATSFNINISSSDTVDHAFGWQYIE